MASMKLWIPCTALALTLAGCAKDDESGSGSEDDSSGSTGGTTQTDTGSASMTTMSSMSASSQSTTMTETSNGSVDDTTSASATATDGTDASATATDGTDASATATDGTDASASATEGSETNTTGAQCEPPGDPCGDCITMNCCDEVQQCEADPDCACMIDCIGMGGDPFQCGQDCMVQQPPPALQALAGCTMAQCGQECGG